MTSLVKSLRLAILGGILLLGGRAPRADAQITAGITSIVQILASPLSGVGTRALR
jgi:hypothetical protein